MPQEYIPFRQRLRRTVIATNAAITPSLMLRAVIQSTTVVCAFCVAMKITGLESFADTFLKARGGLILKTVAMYLLLYSLFLVPARFLRAFLEGWFGLREESGVSKSKGIRETLPHPSK